MKRSSDTGIYLVLFAIFIAALIGLLALAIGLGLVAMGGTRLQQLADLAAMASIERRVLAAGAQPPSPDPDADALVAANVVLNENRIWGMSSTVGELGLEGSPGAAGELKLGHYFALDPDDTGPEDPCFESSAYPQQGVYPCFVPLSAGLPAYPVNASRIELHSQGNNPILAPFGSIFGQENFQIKASTTAALVQTCAAYVIDISFSSVGDTHLRPAMDNITNTDIVAIDPPAAGPDPQCPGYSYAFPNVEPSPNENPRQYHCAVDEDLHQITGYFAYRNVQTTGNNGFQTPDSADYCNGICDSASFSEADVYNREGRSWCNVKAFGGTCPRIRPASPADDPGHYDTDYRAVESRYDALFVDGWRDPQPLTAFFLGINTGLSIVENRAAIGDRAVIIPFTARLRDPYPPQGGSPITRTTTNLSLLRQLTNIQNRERFDPALPGWQPPVHPNPITMGWIPYETGVGADLDTHIVMGVQAAIEALAACPNNARKAIVLLTDGILTCRQTGADYVLDRACTNRTDYSIFSGVENDLFSAPPWGGPQDAIIAKLREKKISLSVIMAGSDVGPNYRVELVEFEPGRFRPKTPKELYQSGIAVNDIFYSQSTNGTGGVISDSDAYRDAGNVSGVVFRRPNMVWGRLALESGGLACPLLPVCTPSQCPGCSGAPCYEDHDTDISTPDVLKACARIAGSYTQCSYTNSPDTYGQAASECVSRAVGGNPFVLVQN